MLEELDGRFHSAAALLKRLNPRARFLAGEHIRVPNVLGAGQETRAQTGAVKIVVSKKTSVLMVYDREGQVIFYAPVTSGSVHDPLPFGNWEITDVVRNPTYNYNPDLFWDADQADPKVKIAAGPNNPVGVVWMGINVPHYGIHGTPEARGDRPFRVSRVRADDKLGCYQGRRPSHRRDAGSVRGIRKRRSGRFGIVDRIVQVSRRRLLFRPPHRVYQTRIWVNGLPLPPQPFRPQLMDFKMQVRRPRIRISRRTNKTDDVPTLHPNSLPQLFRVPIQVRIVIAIRSRFIKLIYCVAARFAEKQFADGSGYHRMHGCPSRLQNVDCLMPMPVVNFFERIPQIREGESADGRNHLENGRGHANGKKHREKRDNTNAEPQAYSPR